MHVSQMTDVFERSLSQLLEYCRTEGWTGYDPYDALNSPLAHAPLLNNRFSRTALTQLVKRSPLNLRPLLRIRKGLNPKGVALAARAVMLIADRTGEALPGDLFTIAKSQREGVTSDLQFLMNQLCALRNPDYDEACWGTTLIGSRELFLRLGERQTRYARFSRLTLV